MKLETFTISRDDDIYEAWPDVVKTSSGKLICVFSECTHHVDRSYTRIMCCESTDRGRTWSAKRPISESTAELDYFLNCARIQQLGDGRLVVIVDRVSCEQREHEIGDILLYISSDDGKTWNAPVMTPARGIVPDRICITPSGRWLLGCHYRDSEFGYLVQRLWYSDDRGDSWEGPVIVGKKEGVHLCEVSIIPVGDALVAFMRENSMKGLDCFKSVSKDDGLTWSDPVEFPLPGCHRPVAGRLQDGRILITYRFIQGGSGDFVGCKCQNFFGAVTDAQSALSDARNEAQARIFPIDHDRSSHCDLGYSGWVQFDNGEVYVVNYIVDDAPKAQIRGYSLCL